MLRLSLLSHFRLRAFAYQSISLLACFAGAAYLLADEQVPNAEEVAVSLRLMAPLSTAGKVSLFLESGDGPEAEGSLVAADIKPPWQGLVAYKPNSRLRVESVAYWAKEVGLFPGAANAEVALWPSTQVHGKISNLSEARVQLNLSFQPVRLDARSKPKVEPSGSAQCSFEGSAFSCIVPEARLDLKLEADAYVPFYFWDLHPSSTEALDLGSLKLERGASVAGWVELPSGVPPEAVGVVLGIEATGFHGDPVLGTQLKRKRREGKVDERGFFQLRGVDPGAWSISAYAKGRPDGPAHFLTIRQDEEHVVPDILTLPEPGRLRVFLEPSAKPWVFSILGRQPQSQLEKIVRNEKLEDGGLIELKDLPVGSFRFRVEDEDGGIWTSGDLEIGPGDNPPLLIEIPQVAVSGKIYLGKEPVEARILFGAMGEQQIPIRSNEEGKFSGSLPREGLWELAAELADGGYVRLEPVRIGGKASELSLRIPAAQVEGTVREDGKLRAGALVLVKEDGGRGRIVGTSTTDSKGAFRIRGLSGGRLGILAKSEDRQSEWKVVEIEDAGLVEDLQIDLVEGTRVRGQVTVQGVAFPGAKITAIPTPSFLGRSSSLSGVDGTFKVLLPAGAGSADLIGLARGYDAIFQHASAGGPSLSLTLESTGGDLILRGLICRPGTHTLRYLSVRLDLFDAFVTFLSVGRAIESSGSLTLEGVPAGGYSVCENESGKCLDVMIPVDGMATLSFEP